jgi:UDP-N-acetylmuramoylalanine--D-glutamate ligase
VIRIAKRADQTIAVLGLGASGLAAARALAASGAKVLAWDDNPEARRRLEENGLTPVELTDGVIDRVKALVLAPGIPYSHSPHHVAARAMAAGVPVIGDIELLLEACPDTKVIGVTGTNGKSTTTALIGHILKTAGVTAQVGGNLGPPVLAFDAPGPDDMLVLELSSFQLDLTRRAAVDIAVLVNISPDHLARHGGMEGYIAAKKNIFRGFETRARLQTAIIGVDDVFSRAVLDEESGCPRWRCLPISAETQCAGGVTAADGVLIDAIDGEAREICRLHDIPTLPGQHNWQNAAAAYAAARAAGIEPDVIVRALATYPGLPHRQELVGEIDGVRFINDSKATNDDAAARALACYDDIYWIAGGQPKEGGLDATMPFLNRVRHAYLIGDAEEAFATRLDGLTAISRCGTLANALAEAQRDARNAHTPGAVVLLSPACASFDQWRSFEARGDGFRALVRDLAAESAA